MSDKQIRGMCEAYLATRPRPGDIHVSMDEAMRSALVWLSKNITEDMENCFRSASEDEMRSFLLTAADYGE